jgi:hypothetical protein
MQEEEVRAADLAAIRQTPAGAGAFAFNRLLAIVETAGGAC